jgi:serine/threonine protein kinase
MEQDLWRRAEQVFHAALDRAPHGRPAFLAEACGQDPDLRRLVDTLLSHDARAGSFLEEPVIGHLASAAAPKGTLVGHRHGSYRFVSLLGAGGMGEVYRARDEKLGRDVAIKTLPPAFAGDPVRLARLRREARALAALNHPNISAIYGLEESGGVNYLVLELVEGVTPKGPLPLASVLALASQLVDALQAAHDRGIVHRDLKPANLKVTPEGRLKVLDFGLATGILSAVEVLSSASESSMTRGGTVAGSIQGTPGYMSPEQARGEKVDQRTDVWAFGCLVYEWLAGSRAFETLGSLDVSPSVLEREPDWHALPTGTPAAIENLLRQCLQVDPARRLPHIRDAYSILREARLELQREDRDGRIDIAQPGPSMDLKARRRRRIRLGIAAGLIALAALSAAALALNRFRQPSSTVHQYALAMPGTTSLGFSVSSSLAVAADGSGVVYLGRNGEKSQLYWHNLRSPGSWPLEGTEGVEGSSTPFLSPDASWLGFFRDGKILKISLRASRLASRASATRVASAHMLRGAAWTSDGAIIFGTFRGGLWEISADGHGNPRRLTEPDVSNGEADHRWPTLLPGERDVLFTIQDLSGRADRAVLAVVSRDTGEFRKIRRGAYGRYLPSGHLVFGEAGTLMAAPFDLRAHRLTGSAVPVVKDVSFGETTSAFAYDVTQDGTLVYVSETAAAQYGDELVWVSREGEVRIAVPGRRAYDAVNFALAADGTRAATSIKGRPYTRIWLWNLRDGRGVPVVVEADCASSAWSPGGDRLAFSSNRDGAFNLYSITADVRGPARRLGESTMMQRPRSWSPDGRYLAFEVQTPATPLEIHILDLANGRSWRWGPGGTGRSEPVFSPDGRWIAYQSRESGRWEVWLRPLAGGEPKYRVSGSAGGLAPAWVRGEIYYIERPNDTRIMSRRVESTTPLRLAPSARVAFALPFALGNTNPYLSLAYAVAPDGRRVLVVRPNQQVPGAINSLNVIAKWSEQVRQKFSAAYTR